MKNEKTTSISIRRKLNNHLPSVLGSEKYSPTVQKEINGVLSIVNSNKNIVDLYSDVLAEVPVSSSAFQDQCVQYEEHHTPHRKLRQCMLEMQSRLDALDTAKNGHLKSLIRLDEKREQIETIEEILEKYDVDEEVPITYSVYLQVYDIIPDLFPSGLANRLWEEDLRDKNFQTKMVNSILRKYYEIKVEHDEIQRGLTSAEHMVKDATMKVIQQKNLVEKYKKEKEETGWSFEISEMVYYVMYFTCEIEKQYRTMGRIDTGTYGVIRNLPAGIRKKVLKNADYIHTQIFVNNRKDTDEYITIEDREILMPEVDLENNTVEGVCVDDFVNMETVKIFKEGAEQ